MWIFWHDWWPVYLIGLAIVVEAIFGCAIIRWLQRRRATTKPCVPITCPPVERVEFTLTLIRCPECGVVPASCHSIFVKLDHEPVWTCPTHGVLDFGGPA